MKILQVYSYFKPAWETGGVTRFVYELSKNLVKKGHDVTVYTTDGSINRLKVRKNRPVMVDGIKTYYFRNISNKLARPYNITTPYMALFVARKELKDFDIIHLHGHRTTLAAVVAHYARQYNVPYVINEGGSMGYDRGRTLLKFTFDFIYGRKILKNADRIIAISEIEKKEFLEYGIDEEKIIIIPNGISKDFIENDIREGKFRDKFNIKEKNILLYLGRINKIKGLDLLIKSFKNLNKNLIKNSKLVIVGPDEGYRSYLEKKVDQFGLSEKVVFTGPLFDKDKLEAYKDSTIFVLPSEYEVFGFVVLEAGLYGLPILLSDGCGISNFLEEKKAVVVFDRNVDELAKKMENLLEDNKKKSEISNRIKNIVLDNFKWDRISEDLLSLYTSLV